MTTMTLLGLISTAALSLPVALIIFFRLTTYKTFPALFIYYLMILAYNVARLPYLHISPDIIDYWNTVNNFLDAPLILYFLSYFSPSVKFTKMMRQVIAGIMIFEIAVISIVGFNNHAITIFLGPAIGIVFAFCLHFFVRQTKITISHHKGIGKAVVTAALLFAYGCYGIIYLMYYVFKMPNTTDMFVIYFAVVTLSSICITIGIAAERKRIRKLNELLQTRKELSVIYKNESGPARSIRTVALDFDKDPWV
jgi:hypothetical protein